MRWEYKVETSFASTARLMQEEFNYFGQDGWEIFDMEVIERDGSMPKHRTIFMKRPVAFAPTDEIVKHLSGTIETPNIGL